MDELTITDTFHSRLRACQCPAPATWDVPADGTRTAQALARAHTEWGECLDAARNRHDEHVDNLQRLCARVRDTDANLGEALSCQ